LLNGFGHCVSYSSVLALDTALATANLNSPSLVPKSIEPGKFTITVWDNCDFLKETESGKGTTHIVNGIQIQTKENLTKSKDYESGPSISKRKRSLKWSSTEIQPFCVGRKTFPKLQDVYRDVDLEQSTHLTTQSFPRKLDLAYVTCKIPEITGNDNLLPGLTGFNTLLSRPKLVNSTVAYLPAIDAPVTEYSTVKEVLKRSVEMADKVELNFMVLVFDEAVYAKIQHIRRMDSTYVEVGLLSDLANSTP
jgi:hypothetical protein